VLVWSVEQPMDSISIGKIENFFMIVRTRGIINLWFW